jgi:hypothetical protein
MFRLKNLPNGAASFGAGVVRLEDSPSRSTGERTDSGTEAAGENAGIEGASHGFVGRRASGGLVRIDFALGIVNKGFMMPLFPEIHPLRESQANIL